MSANKRPASPSRKRHPAKKPAETRKPGAPLGNTNALKHGYYARVFRPTEQEDLGDTDPASLDGEITLLRVFIRRTVAMADKVDNLNDSLTLLNVVSRATLSLSSLVRTRHLANVAQDRAAYHQLVLETKAEVRKANTLSDRLARQLAESEAAYDAIQSALAILFPRRRSHRCR